MLIDVADIRYDEEIWLKVFSVEAFSGVDIAKYFKNGSPNTASTASYLEESKIFRHERMEERLEKTKFIRFSVYDLDMNRVKYLIFQTIAEDNFESWFTWERVYYNWGWSFDDRSTGSDGNLFEIGDVFSGMARYFQVIDRYDNCNDLGWFLAISYISNPSSACVFEKWWLRPDFISAGKTNPHQPPAFLYADTTVADRFIDHKIGGKITIDVFRGKLFSASVITS